MNTTKQRIINIFQQLAAVRALVSFGISGVGLWILYQYFLVNPTVLVFLFLFSVVFLARGWICWNNDEMILFALWISIAALPHLGAVYIGIRQNINEEKYKLTYSGPSVQEKIGLINNNIESVRAFRLGVTLENRNRFPVIVDVLRDNITINTTAPGDRFESWSVTLPESSTGHKFFSRPIVFDDLSRITVNPAGEFDMLLCYGRKRPLTKSIEFRGPFLVQYSPEGKFVGVLPGYTVNHQICPVGQAR